jgi:hypothetical protein
MLTWISLFRISNEMPVYTSLLDLPGFIKTLLANGLHIHGHTTEINTYEDFGLRVHSQSNMAPAVKM